jgi:hypothetical protein
MAQNNLNLELASAANIDERILFMEIQVSQTPYLDRLSAIPHPRVVKTHLPVTFFKKQMDNDDVKIIVPLRNPKDTLVSYYHFYRMNATFGNFTGTWDEFFDLYAQRLLAYGDIFEWYEGWWRYRNNNKVMFVKYEDMKRNPLKEIRRIATFLGKKLDDTAIDKIGSITTFEYMKHNDMTNYRWASTNLHHNISPFMRKGVVGDWKNYFTPKQNNDIEKPIQQLVKLGLEFDFEIKPREHF